MEELIKQLEQEKSHLDKIIKMAKTNKDCFRKPYKLKGLSLQENIREISRNLDRLSEQVQ